MRWYRAHFLFLVGALSLSAACGEPSVEAPDPISGFSEDPRIVPEDILDEGEMLLSRVDVRVDEAAWAALQADPQARTEVPCEVSIGGRLHGGAEIEFHGGFSRTAPKKSYRIKFPQDDQPVVDLFGEGPEPVQRIVLQASWIDRTFMRNKLTMDLIRAEGGLAPRVGYAEVVVNNHYQGLYQLIERVDEEYLKRRGWRGGGNLYKAENHRADWGDKDDPLEGFKKMEGREQPSDDLGELLRTIHATEASFEAFESAVSPALSVEDFITFSLVHIYAMNTDTFTKNYYLYHDPLAVEGQAGARFRIVTWDADATFANDWDGTPISPDEPRLIGHDRFSPRLFGIPEYGAMYRMRMRAALEEGHFHPSSMGERTEALRGLIGEAAGRDALRWRAGDTFSEEVDRLELVFESRAQTLAAALDLVD